MVMRGNVKLVGEVREKMIVEVNEKKSARCVKRMVMRGNVKLVGEVREKMIVEANEKKSVKCVKRCVMMCM